MELSESVMPPPSPRRPRRPAATKEPLGLEPRIDPSARAHKSTLGIYTAVGPRTTVGETVFGGYSYVVNDSSIIRSGVPRCIISRTAASHMDLHKRMTRTSFSGAATTR
jgi:hypothetical protein